MYFQGQCRNFTIISVEIGGTGGQKIASTGKVFGLMSLADFPGSCRGDSRGLPPLMEGKMHVKLANANCVVIYLAGETEGLATSMGVQTCQVNWAD